MGKIKIKNKSGGGGGPCGVAEFIPAIDSGGRAVGLGRGGRGRRGGPQILEPLTPGCCSIRRRKTEENLRVPIRLVKTEDFEENDSRFPRES